MPAHGGSALCSVYAANAAMTMPVHGHHDDGRSRAVIKRMQEWPADRAGRNAGVSLPAAGAPPR